MSTWTAARGLKEGDADVPLGLSRLRSQALLNKNARVFILGRSTEKGQAALAKLKEETQGRGQAEFVVVDLEDLGSVRKGAEELAS